jgi:hypothetical protein
MLRQGTLTRTQERIRLGAIGILAGAVAGLVTGIGARIVMRVVALVTHQAPTFTPATVLLLGELLFLGIAPGIPYVAVRRFIPGPGLVKGLAFGAILFLLIGVPLSQRLPPDERTDLTLGPPFLLTGLFAALFLLYGIALELAEELGKRFVPAPPRSDTETRPMLVYSAVVGLGLLSLLVAGSALLSMLLPPGP